jgi:HoxN/HupN/NixA family high-affinity nickel-transporter
MWRRIPIFYWGAVASFPVSFVQSSTSFAGAGICIRWGYCLVSATEIGLLGISATEASKGLSLWSILVFSTLFAGAMSLVDSTDNILVLGAYGWAFVKPIRKIYYNMTITLVSVVVALWLVE